ncbi:hypothetical protein TD95_002588 [Thielaviopsis punctulata]|uniref:Mmc1 C-terminal domain-containing protein n=1 Tax=Thielaviopsis punctulata TaxID=72032 RepID=A0A0F4ZEB7_9PEZI|nr:hypothetical protein TD95_002588 [Thielaviopsis punctulata]
MTLRLSARLPYSCRKRLTAQFFPRTRLFFSDNSRHAFSSSTRHLSQEAPTANDARAELLSLLQDFRAHAAGHSSLTQLQLAISGLQQPAGDEVIRVAVLGVANGKSAQTAKTLVHALLADPLSEEQQWERKLMDHDPKRSLVVRVGKATEGQAASLISRPNDLNELHISTPFWDKHNIEFLLIEDSRLSMPSASELSHEGLLDVPAAMGGQTLITPVHKSLAVTDGILGASTLGNIEVLRDSSSTLAAVNLPGFPTITESLPFVPLDVHKGMDGIRLFRSSPTNSMKYEKSWSQSNIHLIRDWILAGAKSSPQETKAAVRTLIAGIIERTEHSIQAAEASVTPIALAKTDPELVTLQNALAEWSESAHTELRDELDRAFGGRRWQQLKWWKLFWRVDDVGLFTSEILHERFLPRADKSMIFLAGRISEGVPDGAVSYSQPMSVVVASETASHSSRDPITPEEAAKRAPKWPTHIAFTRRYLQNETVPALQALAQKLVVQALSTSGLSGSLGALLYASQFSVYEAGSVVALGTVLSLGHMQRKWDKARQFWEGDVREEGRKAVRAAEKSMGDVLERKPVDQTLDTAAVHDCSVVKTILEKTKEALSKLQ